MSKTRPVPILGMACVSRAGEHLSGDPAPGMLHIKVSDVSTPYYAIGDDPDDPQRPFHILNTVIQWALDRSGLPSDELAQIGLFMGSSSYDLRLSELDYQQHLESQVSKPVPVNSSGSCRLSDWIGDHFKIDSDAFNINTACTSSANALLLAQQMLNRGIIRHALVIGIELFNETTVSGFSGLQLLAEERLCPFDKQRSGLLLGEGCAALVLGRDERESNYWLSGGGTSFDPHSITAANEDGTSIARALEAALVNSGVDRSRILAIKAQGSGSHSNDLAEDRGLQAIFDSDIPPVTAIKPYIGHTLGACGVLELVLFCQALTDGIIPATPNFAKPDPELSVQPITQEQPAQPGHYLLNTFGFGGNNTVLVVEKRQ